MDSLWQPSVVMHDYLCGAAAMQQVGLGISRHEKVSSADPSMGVSNSYPTATSVI
jgi:hypothetical protein